MVTFSLDGREMQVEPGTTILQAARSAKIEIPTFCYQERLSISASCRMCLVEIEGRGKLEPSCATAVAEGMVVHSHSERVVETRGDMLEILLANHPLDCPVCDKGGECELQDTVFEYGRGSSRLRDSKRVFRNRDIELNQVIVFNANRCIQCQRCVRICEEIVGDVALGTGERGLDSEITGTGNSLKDCSHCGNCIEVCPVGALMSIPYRYKARPWDLQRTETICGMCGTGCSLTAETRDGVFKRVKSRFDTGVNGELLCAKGRFGFDAIDGGTRIREPMIRRDGCLEPVSWQEAVSFIASKVHEAQTGGSVIQGQISPRQTNETAFMFQRLMRRVFGSGSLSSSNRFDGLQSQGAIEALGLIAGKLAARRPLATLLESDCLFLLGSNAAEENPVSAYLIRAAMKKPGKKLLIASSRPGSLDGLAAAALRLRPGSEAHLLALLTGDRLEAAEDAMAGFLAAAAPVLAQAGSIAILLGTEFLRSPSAEVALRGVSHAVSHYRGEEKSVQLQFLFDRPNQLGLWDMGCLPGILPAWVPGVWPEPPADSQLGLFYAMGDDPVSGAGGAFRDGPECLILHGSHMNKTADAADVLLPAPAFGEEDGTFTSNEGRVQNVQAVRLPLGGMPSPQQVFRMIAGAMGENLQPADIDQVYAAICTEVPGFGSFELRTSSADTAKLAHPAVFPAALAVGATAGSRRFLITGDGLFQSGQMSARSKCLSALSGGLFAELNPGTDPALKEGALVRIHRNGSSLTAPLKVNKAFDERFVFVPECYLTAQSGGLLGGARYPAEVTVELIAPGK
ncbi:MAG: molybdopterin-dependent oxidoreductase [Leisingera sp.]